MDADDIEVTLELCSSDDTDSMEDGPGFGLTSPHLSKIIENITKSSKLVK